MKRKIKEEPSANKLVKCNDGGASSPAAPRINLCDLPDELLRSILDFVNTPQHGANFLLSCRHIYQTLYPNHDLFISHRLTIDLNRLMKRIEPPIFIRDRTSPQKKKNSS